MASIQKIGSLAVNHLRVAGSKIEPVEAPSHLPEKPTEAQVATAIGELVEALKSAGIFLPDEAAVGDDEDADGE